MALNTSRSAVRLSRQALRACNNRSSTAAAAAAPALRSSFSTTPARPNEAPDASSRTEVPRWAQTPERMKAPFSPHVTKDPARSKWKVNSDPKKLDAALNNFLGPTGDRMLPDELKWLAVTHKSFDQGRRGFNDRLAYLGTCYGISMSAWLDPTLAHFQHAKMTGLAEWNGIGLLRERIQILTWPGILQVVK